MKLYEISEAIENCIDTETGEINAEALEKLLKAEGDKLEGIGKKIKSLKAESAALKAEIDMLKERKASTDAALDNLARFVGQYLGGEKRTVGTIKFSFLGKQEGKVNLLCKAAELPEQYRKPNVSWREDVTAIREAILAGDKDIAAYAALDPRPKATVK